MKGPGFWKHGGMVRPGFLNKRCTGRSRPAAVCQPCPIDCPERKEQVHFVDCLECEKFQVWHSMDGDMKSCWYEFKDLKSRGHYDGTWDDHPENFDPETFAEIQERKRLNAEVNRELESEFAEFKSRAEELAVDSRTSNYYEYYWEDENDEDSEEGEKLDQDQTEDDDEEDYF